MSQERSGATPPKGTITLNIQPMKARLNLKTQDWQGREPKYTENIGYITSFIQNHENEGSITVDAFKGHGERYRRREEALIIIRNGSQEWQGTFKSLLEILFERQQQNEK